MHIYTYVFRKVGGTKAWLPTEDGRGDCGVERPMRSSETSRRENKKTCNISKETKTITRRKEMNQKLNEIVGDLAARLLHGRIHERRLPFAR